MKKQLIALQGDSNSGKTHTLKELIKLLVKEYPSANITCYRKYRTVMVKNIDYKSYMSTGNDKVVVLEIKNDFKVAIITYGDPSGDNPFPVLECYLDHMVSLDCDVIFCGCRKDVETVEYVDRHAASYDILFIPQDKKRFSQEFTKYYMPQAERLMNLAKLQKQKNDYKVLTSLV